MSVELIEMRSTSIPATLEIPFSALLALGQECWRLGRMAPSLTNQSQGMACRRAIREISSLLAGQSIQIEDHFGRAYDPGMALEVLDVIEDPVMPPGTALIEKTVLPTVTWRGLIVMQGQIIVRQSPGTHETTPEENQ